MINFLSGYKTFILAGLGILVVIIHLLGWLDASSSNAILTILGFGSIITLRSAIAGISQGK